MFSDRIKEILLQKKITQKDFLRDCGLGDNSFANWDRAKDDNIEKFPNGEKLLKIANYLDVAVDYLLGRIDIPNPYKEKKVYSSYEQFLGMCNRSGESPEQVFNSLGLPLWILSDWQNGKMPQDKYEELGDKSVLWLIANHFDENKVWGRPNPFMPDYTAQLELLQWFNNYDITEKIKIVEFLKTHDILNKNIAVIDATQSITAATKKDINKTISGK